MKASVSRAATASVLAGIDAAVRPVERARTSAAADRVLDSACPGIGEPWGAYTYVTVPLLRELGLPVSEAVRPVFQDCGLDGCSVCDDGDVIPVDGLGEWFRIYLTPSAVDDVERERYAPWNVSPHLFGGES